MSLDRAAALMEEEMISEAFAAIACAGNGHRRTRARVYVVDELVLTVTERESSPTAAHREAAATSEYARIRDGGALQRRAAVEAVTGRRVAATLGGRRSDPEVRFELFMLETR